MVKFSQLIISWAYQYGRRFLWLRTLLFKVRWRWAFRGIRGGAPPSQITTISDLLREKPDWLTVEPSPSLAEKGSQGQNTLITDQQVAYLSNGLIWGGGAVITSDRRILRDRSPELGAPDRWHRALMLPCLPEPTQSFDCLVSLSVSVNHGNYFHWLLDEFSRLAFLPETIKDPLFLYSDRPWQRQFLALADIPLDRCVSATIFESVRAKSLVVPPLVGYGETDKVRHAIAFLRRLRDRHFPPPRECHAVYLTRGNTSRRPINDDDLLEVLSARGVQVLDTGSMSVADQINSLYGANLIMAAHGAALANMVFAAPGARVIEFRSQHYQNNFRGLAKACGHEYHECICPVPASERWRPMTQRGYAIPIQDVLKRVDSIG